jgi:hypothetical protein
MNTPLKSGSVKTVKRIVLAFLSLTVALLVTDFITGYKKYCPIGNGIITATWVEYATGRQPLTEVDVHSIESAVLDSDNWVFVMHYYIPGDPKAREQNEILEHLNSYYGGKVTFLQLDLDKHQDIPLCAGIKSPVIIAYCLTRANTDKHKMTGYNNPPIPHNSSYQGLLAGIQYLRFCEYDNKAHPKEWTHSSGVSYNGRNNSPATITNTDDSNVASRRVPFWNWYSEYAEEAEAIYEQQ